MMNSAGVRTQFLDFIYICRAIFHATAANGIRVSFFSNCIMTAEM
ncbi:RAxF-45 family protein [Bacillus sp. 165]|nr:RAxF-45 family protein [Bacillus sp. 165]